MKFSRLRIAVSERYSARTNGEALIRHRAGNYRGGTVDDASGTRIEARFLRLVSEGA
jgi:hypothetical protein